MGNLFVTETPPAVEMEEAKSAFAKAASDLATASFEAAFARCRAGMAEELDRLHRTVQDLRDERAEAEKVHARKLAAAEVKSEGIAEKLAAANNTIEDLRKELVEANRVRKEMKKNQAQNENFIDKIRSGLDAAAAANQLSKSKVTKVNNNSDSKSEDPVVDDSYNRYLKDTPLNLRARLNFDENKTFRFVDFGFIDHGTGEWVWIPEGEDGESDPDVNFDEVDLSRETSTSDSYTSPDTTESWDYVTNTSERETSSEVEAVHPESLSQRDEFNQPTYIPTEECGLNLDGCYLYQDTYDYFRVMGSKKRWQLMRSYYEELEADWADCEKETDSDDCESDADAKMYKKFTDGTNNFPSFEHKTVKE